MSDRVDDRTVSCRRFVGFGGEDLDRWRELIGQAVQHEDRRWGTGRVVDVRWANSLPQVPAHVQLKIRYGDTEVLIRAAGLAEKHEAVTVPSRELAQLIAACYGALDEKETSDVVEHPVGEECGRLLASYTEELRERRTRERLDRVAALQEKIKNRFSDQS